MPDFSWYVGNCARYGHLVYYMNQSRTAPLSEPGPWGAITGGYCGGLSVRWMRLAYAGSDYKGKPGYSIGGQAVKVFDGTDWMATVYQNKLKDYNKATSPSLVDLTAFTVGLGQMTLGKDLLEEASGAATGAKLFRVLKQSYGCYYVYMGGVDSAHAIALRHAKPTGGSGPGVLHIFDPNSGHFAWQTKSADWTQLIDSFLHFRGYDKDFRSKYLISRVIPPQSW